MRLRGYGMREKGDDVRLTFFVFSSVFGCCLIDRDADAGSRD